MKKLTVVVTIYKVEGYLRKCLNSILSQTFTDFQALLVVGSTDEACIEICNQYAEKDSRVTVIASKPRGLSEARNIGIRTTETEYITFVDGDDYLVDTAFETLMERIQDCDIAIGTYLVDNGSKTAKAEGDFREGVYSRQEALVSFLNGHGIQFVVAWGKIYRTSLFTENVVFYPLGKLHEDNLTTYKLLYHARKICYTDIPVYVYVDRTDSLSYNMDIGKEKVIIEDLQNLREYLGPIEELTENIEAYAVRILISYMRRLAKSSDENYGEYLHCVNKLKGMKIQSSKYLRIRMKMLCVAIVKMPRMSFSILRI